MRLVGASEAYSLVRNNNKTQIVKPQVSQRTLAAFCYSMAILLLELDVLDTSGPSLSPLAHSCKENDVDI